MAATAIKNMHVETPLITAFDSWTTSVTMSSSPSWTCSTTDGTAFINDNVVVKPAAYTAHVMSALLALTAVAIGTIVINCVHDPSVGRRASIDSVRIVPAEVNPPPFEPVVQRLLLL